MVRAGALDWVVLLLSRAFVCLGRLTLVAPGECYGLCHASNTKCKWGYNLGCGKKHPWRGGVGGILSPFRTVGLANRWCLTHGSNQRPDQQGNRQNLASISSKSFPVILTQFFAVNDQDLGAKGSLSQPCE